MCLCRSEQTEAKRARLETFILTLGNLFLSLFLGFVPSYAVGAASRLGFGPEQVFDMVKDRERGIVYVEASAFGFSGPYADAPGFEHLA